ncbi:alcohol dehydrogenase, partial [Piedraia hortae CBS 480.64]
PDTLTVTLLTASLNHRDIFLRQNLYPGGGYNIPLGADGCGIVTSPPSSPFYNKRVIIQPGKNWDSDLAGPEGPQGPKDSKDPSGGKYAILGGTKPYPSGTLSTHLSLPEHDLVLAPPHLSDPESAALPLTGLTAYRAVFTKGCITPNSTVLVTGIGGGVAIMALLFAVAVGARVYVTSSDEGKIARAVELGAKGGVNYKHPKWEGELGVLVGGEVDVVVDGAGGDIASRAGRVLKQGGIIVSYGMTTGPQMSFPMSAVLKNIELRGSTMGSRREFREMVEFVNQHKIKPVVSRVVEGLEVETVERLFDDMKNGKQFGKLVVRI